MKIAYCSDLHLEFGDIVLNNDEQSDVLLLCGDITVAFQLNEKNRTFFNRTIDFFEDVCSKFKHVIYVMGNHEHYSGDFATTYQNLQHHLGHILNLVILDKQTYQLDDVVFIGGTLWTSMNNRSPEVMLSAQQGMNDYRKVDNSNRITQRTFKKYKYDQNGRMMYDNQGNAIIDSYYTKESPARFSPDDAVDDHEKMVEFIEQTVKSDTTKKYIVVGHHAPSYMSISPRFQYDRHNNLNHAYSSDLSNLILDNPQIKYWFHGHTHEPFEYTIGETRICCNPRGYHGYEATADEFQLKTIEI